MSADGSYTNIHLDNGQKITVSKGLKYFEDTLLQNEEFMRCQKSNIINLTKVTEFVKTDGGMIVLNNKFQVAVSVDKFQELNRRLKEVVKIL
jgi:two-component system LytT family response regulator